MAGVDKPAKEKGAESKYNVDQSKMQNPEKSQEIEQDDEFSSDESCEDEDRDDNTTNPEDKSACVPTREERMAFQKERAERIIVLLSKGKYPTNVTRNMRRILQHQIRQHVWDKQS